MVGRVSLLATPLLLAAAATDVPLPDDQAAMKAHVLFLASDAMKGREAGTLEYDIAAQYLAAQFYAAGLTPAGDAGSYLQKVPLLGYRPDGPGDFYVTRSNAPPVHLTVGADYTPFANPAAAVTSANAQVVLVGQGIVAPQYRRDDYLGVSVKGRIVAFFGGAPLTFQPEERAHFASVATKALLARDRGAIGYVVIDRAGFAGEVRRYEREKVTWAQGDGSGFSPGAPPLGTLSDSGGAALFDDSPAYRDAVRAGETGVQGRPVVSVAHLAVATRTRTRALPSSNVAGLLPGADPKLAHEIVVLSAHLDHVGICPEVAGDSICNGAEDNAVGIASLIEEAKRFKAAGKPPRRSILFLGVTAEEKGLVGADYFARHPSVPAGNIVADVNLDMPILTYAFEDMTVFGANRSTLGPIVARAAATVGVGMSPDPSPEMGLFTRSDHYRFVQKGIPSVFLWPGQKGAGKVAWAEFFARHYHKPSDEVTLPIDWAQGVRFVAVNYAIAREIADADARPVWNKGDFFGTLYKGPMAR